MMSSSSSSTYSNSSAKEEESEADKLDKYTKGLVSSLGHLMGLREGWDGKLHATVEREEEDNRGCVSIENINLATAQKWRAGGFTEQLGKMNILPPEKVSKILERVEEVSASCGTVTGPKKPGVPPNSSTSVTGVKRTAGKAKPTDPFKDPLVVSKGGFFPPRRVIPTATESSNAEGISKYEEATTRTSLFSEYKQSANKKPAYGLGNKPEPVDDKPFARNVGRGRGRGAGNRWDMDDKKDDSNRELDSGDGLGGSAFRSAYQQLLIDDKRKGIQRPQLPSLGSGPKLGLSRPPPGKEPERNPNQRKSDENEKKVSDNPEVQEIMEHESMKNIEPKMVEAILNEVIQVSTTEWSDIAGLDGVKKIIREIIIWPMERPDIFTGLRAAPRGILFFGPPGTGKTMFGRVIATQSKSTFFNISASSLTSKWMGEGEKMVRALFAVARVKQPSVIFIDEIDSILTQRSDTEHESSRRLKTEFLIQFDGCATSSEDRILVIGVTNRPQELDEAARRRLVKRIYIPLPDFVARKQLVKNLIKEYSSELSEADFDKIANMTEGYSGADMTSLCREAAYGPIREVGHLLQSLDLSKVRPMRMKDFLHAQRQVKSSVAESDVELYADWDAKFGCHIGYGLSPDESVTLSQMNQSQD